MNVFFSWSGDTSRKIAELFVEWLPKVVQKTEPFFSPNDVAKGTRWATEIATHLEGCSIGFLFMTQQNLTAPWIMFEAGALSKHIADSRICCLLFGVGVGDIKGPLEQFNHTVFRRDEIHRIVLTANEILPGRTLSHEQITKIFDMWWPELEKAVSVLLAEAEANNGVQAAPPERMTDADYFKEMNGLLELMRSTVRQASAKNQGSVEKTESDDVERFRMQRFLRNLSVQIANNFGEVCLVKFLGGKFHILMADEWASDDSMRTKVARFVLDSIMDSGFAKYDLVIGA